MSRLTTYSASRPGLVLRPELVDDGLLLLGEPGTPKVISYEPGFPGRELCAGQIHEKLGPGYILRIVRLAALLPTRLPVGDPGGTGYRRHDR
jgi:hypothetical protein